MLVTSMVASRIGTKRTLLAGLILIIILSALADASNSIGAIVGLRAGWGLGNALFTAFAVGLTWYYRRSLVPVHAETVDEEASPRSLRSPSQRHAR